MAGNPPFTDDAARAAWNEGAAAWEAFVETGADYYRTEVHGPALLAACGDVGGKRVLDLGCGQGYFSRQLAMAGASVVGVDIADRLISLARDHEEQQPLGIEYLNISATRVDERWEPGSFDLVTGCMSLHDMSAPGDALRAARAVLRQTGRVVVSVTHPCTNTPVREWERDERGRKLALKIDRYFEGGTAICDWNFPRLLYAWQTPHWRYTLEQWSDMISAAGLIIERMTEPHPTPERVREHPELEDCSKVPYFLIFTLRGPR